VAAGSEVKSVFGKVGNFFLNLGAVLGFRGSSGKPGTACVFPARIGNLVHNAFVFSNLGIVEK
jgi:hypothetical protein